MLTGVLLVSLGAISIAFSGWRYFERSGQRSSWLRYIAGNQQVAGRIASVLARRRPSPSSKYHVDEGVRYEDHIMRMLGPHNSRGCQCLRASPPPPTTLLVLLHSGQPGAAEGRGGQAGLRFRSSGEFTILQFPTPAHNPNQVPSTSPQPKSPPPTKSPHPTIMQVSDPHICDSRAPCDGLTAQQRAFPCSDHNTTDFLRRAIVRARPDLVLFTGDLICAGAGGPFEAMRTAVEPAIAAAIPWAFTFGNHDDESSRATRSELFARISTWPGNAQDSASVIQMARGELNRAGGDANGELNLATYALLVEADGASDAPGAAELPRTNGNGGGGLALWIVDSGSGTPAASGSSSTTDIQHAPRQHQKPLHMSDAQLDWLESSSAKLRRMDQEAGVVRTSLAFLHLPLPEFALVVDRVFTGSCYEQIESCSGMEPTCALLFDVLKTQVRAKAVLAGHDHVNDYCGEHHGVHLCYAGSAGYRAYGRPGLARRVRVIRALARGQTIATHKLLDEGKGFDSGLRAIDCEVLFSTDAPTAARACTAYGELKSLRGGYSRRKRLRATGRACD
ncbi:Metallo-dependent phosphatase-like protein [Pavlovales sp. CCMP2436]|nr:Metallo-dependent phosphatase-like protein [Pavlovales sp. CCMP2436]